MEERTTMACPSDATLDDYAAGRLDAPARAPVEQHLAGCWECRETVAELGRVSPPPARVSQRVAGRFSILEVLGQGGMGTVCAAYDPLLDRRVAIKFVALSNLAPDAQELLRAEATALAKVSHPCVVPLHDVLVEGGSVLLVMEHVAGPTVDVWVSQHQPPLEVLLALLAQCAGGLGAVHDAGLVHGDVKPANILVRADGRPCIIDFGLARVTGAHLPPGGRAAGTPAYMAPEQRGGVAATPASDQFSFCAAAAEMLLGQRPPTQDTAVWVRAHAPAHLPPHVLDALVTGLAPAVDQRHTSMGALADVLARRAGTRRATRALVAGVVVTALGLLGSGYAATVLSCQAATGDLRAVMQGPSLGEAAQRFEGGLDGSRAAWAAAEKQLWRFVDQWESTRRGVCLSPGATTAQTACLQRSVREVEVLLRHAAPAAATADKGLQPLAHLSDATACLQAARPIPVDPAARQEVAAVRDQLAAVDGLLAAGQSSQALEAAQHAAGAAQHAGFPPLHAEAQQRLGRAAVAAARYPVAEAALWQATAGAFQQGDVDTAQQLLAQLMLVTGALLARPDAAGGISQLALALVERTSDPRGAELVYRHMAGRVDRAASRHAQAEAAQRRALELAEGGAGLGRLHTWDLRNELGVALLQQGQTQAALAQLQRVVEELVDAVGPQHPLLCAARTNVGLALKRAGAANALEELEAAETLCLSTVGPSHARSWSAMNNVGDALLNAGRAAQAQARFAACVDAATAVVGPDHATTLVCHKGLGDAQQQQDRHAQAWAVYQDILPRMVSRLGQDHASVASARVAASRSLLALGRAPQALELAQLGLDERVNNKRDALATAEAQGAVALALRALRREPRREKELMDAAVMSLRALGAPAQRQLALLGQAP